MKLKPPAAARCSALCTLLVLLMPNGLAQAQNRDPGAAAINNIFQQMLRPAQPAPAAPAPARQVPVPLPGNVNNTNNPAGAAAAGLFNALNPQAAPAAAPAQGGAQVQDLVGQIGRASCRERV